VKLQAIGASRCLRRRPVSPPTARLSWATISRPRPLGSAKRSLSRKVA